ncbi:hypothetical protein OG369_28725 [Streptomyces sp. NBC_01221]|uniref:hypothetical protein n=1 Tax=unclassified Streptomyces TaxID=2593676 RepID=UPI0022514E24|nr:hypothetical protein [Streptomyces sp. NBC_01221]MCX4790022.1 hypothetical protein [Streptomyces sp. NBC_01221]
MRKNVPAHPLLDALDRGRVPALDYVERELRGAKALDPAAGVAASIGSITPRFSNRFI